MNEKFSQKNLGGMMPDELVDAFTAQVEQRGQKNKRSLAAAVKLWIGLPEAVQARLLNQSLDADAFIELVEQIVDARIEAGRQAARRK